MGGSKSSEDRRAMMDTVLDKINILGKSQQILLLCRSLAFVGVLPFVLT